MAGLFFVLTSSARLVALRGRPHVYPAPYYFSYAVAKYRHATRPELALLSLYCIVLWDEVRHLAQRPALLPVR
jgi:hypothetical protein